MANPPERAVYDQDLYGGATPHLGSIAVDDDDAEAEEQQLWVVARSHVCSNSKAACTPCEIG